MDNKWMTSIFNRNTEMGLSKDTCRYIVAIFIRGKTGVFKNMVYSYNGMLQTNKINTIPATWLNFSKMMLNKNQTQKYIQHDFIVKALKQEKLASGLGSMVLRSENHIASGKKERVPMRQHKGSPLRHGAFIMYLSGKS